MRVHRASERTTMPRVIAGALFSHLAPSLILGTVYDLFVPRLPHSGAEAESYVLAAPMMGLLLGWPYLAAGLAAWALLAQIERHYPWAAALVGTAVGASVAWFSFRDGLFFEIQGAWPLCTGVGLLTGLGVWWIAYGRQWMLKPVAAPPRSRLVL